MALHSYLRYGAGVALALTGAFAVMLLVLVVISRDMIVHEYYASYNDMLEGSAVERGWVPSFVPQSATDIRETHCIERSDQWMKFRFEPSEMEEMLEMVTPVAKDSVRLPPHGPTIICSWWPHTLVNNTKSGELSNYEFYEYKSARSNLGYLAIESDKPRAWYWQQGTWCTNTSEL